MSDLPTTPTPPALPAHEHASLSLGLGIVGLLGLLTCGAGFLVSPFALAYGLSSRRAIREHPDRWRGDGMALTGIVLGVVGTVLLVLVILAALVLAILVMNGTVHSTVDGGFST